MADESDVMSILSFSILPEFTAHLRVKFYHEVMKDIENQVGFYKNCGKYLIMQEIFSLKLEMGQSVTDHLMEMKRLFKCLSRLGYKMAKEELVYLMWFLLQKEVRVTASDYMGEPRMDVAKVYEDISNSLEPKTASAELIDTDWIDELGDLSCLECDSQDVCVQSFNAGQMDIGLPDAPGIFMIDCLNTSYESWGFNRRETLRKDLSNLRVGEGTMLIAVAVGSYNLSLPWGLVLELEDCYYVPKMIKNIISFDLLVEHGFYFKYNYKMISWFTNDVFYFKATPTNGLYHCRLGPINKKPIEQLQKGGLLGSFDFRPFNNCESCLFGKRQSSLSIKRMKELVFRIGKRELKFQFKFSDSEIVLYSESENSSFPNRKYHFPNRKTGL
ncbi:hypothetical protein OSB04_024095 [Centaurea solstitialis]|uniref:GAG-pre-integrase domain-containing protein n=1 Tax=Centaurea solstitialis TaxID=347529 RepID=A0AA38T4Z0_9ASTR|nr:hypothetical protein OSB04_024095 [Centaurea solstitialis]